MRTRYKRFVRFQESRECLARLLDAMLCRICMDRSLDTALFPCGHAVACLDCARRCERCPLCRADIDYCRTIYLPIELTHIDKHNPKLLSETIEPVFSKPLTEEIKDKRILDSETSVNSNIWERRVKLGAFERFFRIVTCRAERVYWNTGVKLFSIYPSSWVFRCSFAFRNNVYPV